MHGEDPGQALAAGVGGSYVVRMHGLGQEQIGLHLVEELEGFAPVRERWFGAVVVRPGRRPRGVLGHVDGAAAASFEDGGELPAAKGQFGGAVGAIHEPQQGEFVEAVDGEGVAAFKGGGTPFDANVVIVLRAFG
jgi:hypothetical protein